MHNLAAICALCSIVYALIGMSVFGGIDLPYTIRMLTIVAGVTALLFLRGAP